MACELSIIIPVFNEQDNLNELIKRLSHTIASDLSNLELEVLLVDDHSDDNSWNIIESGLKEYPWLKAIRLLKNSGSHVAIFAGLSHATGESAYIMGADLQDPPELISQFLATADQNFDIVLGERNHRKDPFLKRFFSSGFNRFMSAFVMKHYPGTGGDVFLIKRPIMDAVIACNEKNTNIFVLILSFSTKIGTVRYDREKRFAGESKWTFTKLMKLALDSLVAVSLLPLKIVLVMGIITFIGSMLMIAFVIYQKLSGDTSTEGFASLMAAIFGFGGLNMISLAVIGEYLWRNLEQTRSRPIFICEKKMLKDEVDVSV